MLWTVIIALLSGTKNLAYCHETQGYSLSGRRDVSNDVTYLSIAYYVNWAIYGRKFNPQDLPADKLTHALYAFANISPGTGEVYLSDTWADAQIHFAGDSSNETGTNLYGCLKQFYLLKKANRNLKVLLAIGGSTYSSNFAKPASTSSGRETFAVTAVSLVKNFGLDGLDIDWEYPADDVEASNMVLLLEATRAALDAYGNSLSPSYHFQLTVACPAGPSYYQVLHLANMDRYVDFWNLMAYDYAGPWSKFTANQANLFHSTRDPATTPFNTEGTVDYYVAQGIAVSKIVLGMPVYGRSFEATQGLGAEFSGVGTGTWEAGIYDFKALPLSGAVEVYDNATASSYSYDAGREELISYDTIAVAKQKAALIKRVGLRGAMWWESSGDKTGKDSLIQNVVEILSDDDGLGLEDSPNQLLYSDSIYENLRIGMPWSSSVSVSTSNILYNMSKLSSSTTLQTFGLLPASSSDPGETSSGSTSISNLTMINCSLTQGSTRTSSSTLRSPFYSHIETQTSRGSHTNTAVVPGENGVPGCAYVLASDLGAGALCLSDYCNCGGTVAPLLTSSISGTLTTNCNYQTQPTTHSCAALVTSSTSSATSAPDSVHTVTMTTTLPASPPSTITSTTYVIGL